MGKRPKKTKPKEKKATAAMRKYWKTGKASKRLANAIAVSKASQGNQFWMQRSKHGRDKLFSTPQLLWEAACEYFQSITDSPDKDVKPAVVSLGGGMGSKIKYSSTKLKRPFSIWGLCRYLGCAPSYISVFKMTQQKLDTQEAQDFLNIIKLIEATIMEQQFDGATIGKFNANIISRAMGLVDKTDLTSNGETVAPQAPIINIISGETPQFDKL